MKTMKSYYITKIKSLVSLILVVITLIISTGCENVANGLVQENANSEDKPSYSEYDAFDVTSPASLDYIQFSVEDDLQEAFPGYSVDYVECIYISEEYISEMYYNSLSNIYYGYDYDEIASYMQDTSWTFTVDDNGQTVVTEVAEPSNALRDMIKKVAIGTGVIVICVVLSCVTGGAAAPVACFFAGAAKGALVGAVSGAAVSGVIGGAIAGVQTKSWEGALNGAITSAVDGYMWGAISGALVGGFSSSACFAGDTLVKISHGYTPICDIDEGDSVYSFNESTGLYEYIPVSRITKRTIDNVVKLTVSGEEITTTTDHPFYTSEGWVDAKDLSTESLVLTNEGYIRVDSVEFEALDEVMWVFNLTVPYTHTYTVSKEDVVVHNACGDSAKLRKNLIDAGDAVPDYPNAAHHIVPSSDARYAQAAQARDKLLSLGVDINDASNGVFLSTSKSVAGTTYHRTIHTAQYYDKVNSLLSSANTKGEAIEVLAYIKEALMNGTFLP